MHSYGFGTKVLTFGAAAVGLMLSLGLPYYGPSKTAAARAENELPELGGPVEEFFGGIWRWFSDGTGSAGKVVLETPETAIYAVGGLALLVCLLLFVPAVEQVARSLAQVAGFGALAVVAWALIDQPGVNANVEPRYGLMLAALCAVLMAVFASSIAAAKLKRPPRKQMSSLHDESLTQAPGTSAGPPRR